MGPETIETPIQRADDDFIPCRFCPKLTSKMFYLFHLLSSHQDKILVPSIRIEFRQDDLNRPVCNNCYQHCSTHVSLNYHESSQEDGTGISNIDWDNLTCHSCYITFSNSDSLRSHMNLIHKISENPNEEAVDNSTLYNTSPSTSDFDSFKTKCFHCNLYYHNRNSYTEHHRLTHNLGNTLEDADDLDTAAYVVAVPDIYDPQFHCRSCRKSYKNKASYMNHLRRIHHMRLKSYKKRTNNPPQDKNSDLYCSICNFTYKSVRSFNYHVYSKHKHRKLTITQGLNPQPNVIPDLNSPYCYCQVCDIVFKSKKAYKQHVIGEHNVEPQTTNTQNQDANSKEAEVVPSDTEQEQIELLNEKTTSELLETDHEVERFEADWKIPETSTLQKSAKSKMPASNSTIATLTKAASRSKKKAKKRLKAIDKESSTQAEQKIEERGAKVKKKKRSKPKKNKQTEKTSLEPKKHIESNVTPTSNEKTKFESEQVQSGLENFVLSCSMCTKPVKSRSFYKNHLRNEHNIPFSEAKKFPFVKVFIDK